MSDAGQAAARIHGWLAGDGQAAAEESVAGSLRWLLAAWMCESGLGVGGALTATGARQLAARLDGQPEAQAFAALLACDVRHVALAHGITRGEGVVCERLDAFVSGLAASLHGVDGESGAGEGDLYEARFLVSRLGLGPAPALVALDGDDLPSTLGLLQATEDEIGVIATRVAAATACGTAAPEMASGARAALLEVIPVWLLHFARAYKLTGVAQMVRALEYLGAGTGTPAQDGLRFLLAQQHPSGRIGFLGPEAAAAARADPAWSADRELYLPITLACLWAFAECDRRFRAVPRRAEVPARPTA